MKLPAALKERDVFWDAAILVTAAAALLLNLTGLLYGISVVIPHLLYIPVVIASGTRGGESSSPGVSERYISSRLSSLPRTRLPLFPRRLYEPVS